MFSVISLDIEMVLAGWVWLGIVALFWLIAMLFAYF
jgi:hypothetical protein